MNRKQRIANSKNADELFHVCFRNRVLGLYTDALARAEKIKALCGRKFDEKNL